MNKVSFLRSRKFRHGSVAVILTAFVIAAVVILNVIFTALSQKYMWYTDMTTEKLYTLQRVGKIFFHHAGDSDFLTFGRIFKSFFQCGVGLAL